MSPSRATRLIGVSPTAPEKKKIASAGDHVCPRGRGSGEGEQKTLGRTGVVCLRLL